jgi:hypothetical protein
MKRSMGNDAAGLRAERRRKFRGPQAAARARSIRFAKSRSVGCAGYLMRNDCCYGEIGRVVAPLVLTSTSSAQVSKRGWYISAERLGGLDVNDLPLLSDAPGDNRRLISANR